MSTESPFFFHGCFNIIKVFKLFFLYDQSTSSALSFSSSSIRPFTVSYLKHCQQRR